MSESKIKRPRIVSSLSISSLSARLLVFTIFFIMLSELLIYAPSIARHRLNYLEDRIATAYLATKALEAADDNFLSPELEREILFLADAYSVVLRRPNRDTLFLKDRPPPPASFTFDLHKGNFVSLIIDAFTSMIREENRTIRVIGAPAANADVSVEVVHDDRQMRKSMQEYSARILKLSIVISLITGIFVFLSLRWMIVRPLRRITKSMIVFRENPEDLSAAVPPTSRADEIGIAQRELAEMQNNLRASLKQKTRLAAMGAAVAKINHDLRNSLATAVLASGRLADIDDPEVKRLTPRLYAAINHAVDLCSQTLNYVSDASPQLEKTLFHLHELVNEVGAAMREAGAGGKETCFLNEVEFDLDVTADRKQFFRALINLAQNSFQAGASEVRVKAEKKNGSIEIDVMDNGPGLSPRAKENLFKPFAGSARKGGIGIGLVIARDILSAHGGSLELLQTSGQGAAFRMEIPGGG